MKTTKGKNHAQFNNLIFYQELDKMKKDMPVPLKEERDRRTKGKEKSETKQRKRLVIEEVESDEETQGNHHLLTLTFSIAL